MLDKKDFLCFAGMSLFLKNVSFHGILLDALFTEDSSDWQTVADLVRQGMESGEVRPLNSTIYEHEHVEQAFRYMAQGKHTGKVLIKVRAQCCCFFYIFFILCVCVGVGGWGGLSIKLYSLKRHCQI